jgi:hypothetical protein
MGLFRALLPLTFKECQGLVTSSEVIRMPNIPRDYIKATVYSYAGEKVDVKMSKNLRYERGF